MSKKRIVLKYGGNAMTDAAIQEKLIEELCQLKEKGHEIIIVHGGGPFIQEALDRAGIESEFISGQRKTSKEAFEQVEMVLKGKVNGRLVNLINKLGYRAVGLSGKDGHLVTAKKRYHLTETDGITSKTDLGMVGDVDKVHTDLLELLLANDYMPVITCIASDREGNDFNINGDVFAGHIAAALRADEYIVLTDVDGLMRDIKDPSSVIRSLRLNEISELVEQKIIVGGMIPKIEACANAITKGTHKVRILNGTKPEQLNEADSGTEIIA
ncbi:MAG: acetylglutamate kinase [Cyclobacteriaceae bacterium]